jgi:hypothetical protein
MSEDERINEILIKDLLNNYFINGLFNFQVVYMALIFT